MIQYRKILELYFQGLSNRTISSSTGSSRNTIASIIQRAKDKEIEHLAEHMTNQWLSEMLFPEKQAVERGYYPLDLEFIHKELFKKNMTLRLLHREYAEQAEGSNKLAYSYRSFADKYGRFASKHKATMPLKKKPGEELEVDWAGSTLSVTDPNTGEPITVYIFVATLSYSQYSYVDGFFDMKSANWLTAHIHAFEFFNGVPNTLVIDNLKTGVTTPYRGDPLLNEAFRELADFYQTVIVPARVKRPKDKPSVEGAVGFVSRQIIAALRNYQCFDLRDLNTEIWRHLKEINEQAFQKRPGSRKKIFDEEESMYLQALRRTRFKLSEWRIAKVQLNYHIQVERMQYSVPYEYIRDFVDVRLSKDLIEVYFNEVRIASHKRLYGVPGQSATLVDHMPENHQLYYSHTPEKNRQWAKTVGPSMSAFVEHLLQNTSEKQALVQLGSLRNTEKTCTKSDLEAAAESLMLTATQPTVSVFNTILKRRLKSNKKDPLKNTRQSSEAHGFIRGKDYFGGRS